jgi:hypothetical protein
MTNQKYGLRQRSFKFIGAFKCGFRGVLNLLVILNSGLEEL